MKGFTMIEILVTVGLIVFVSGLVLFGFSDLFHKRIIEQDAHAIVSLYITARSKSMAAYNDTTYGVCVSSTGATIFSGTSCSSGTEVASYIFNNTITVTDNTVPTDGILFAKDSGTPSSAARVTLSRDTHITIIMNEQGVVYTQ